MLTSSGPDLDPDPILTLTRPVQNPRLPTVRAGAFDVRFGRSWYRRARIEMLYIVVYLFYMFEAFTYVKIHKEPNVHVILGYILRVFLYFSMFSETCMVAHMYITT